MTTGWWGHWQWSSLYPPIPGTSEENFALKVYMLEAVKLGKSEDEWMVECRMILCVQCTQKFSTLRKCASEHVLCVCSVVEPERQCITVIMCNSVFVFYTQIILFVCQILWWWRVCVSQTCIGEHPDCLLHYEWSNHAFCLLIHTVECLCMCGHLWAVIQLWL